MAASIRRSAAATNGPIPSWISRRIATALFLPCCHGLGQRPPQSLLQTEVVGAAGKDVTESLMQPLAGSAERLEARPDCEAQLSHMDFSAWKGLRCP
jgi:hypothetical protein